MQKEKKLSMRAKLYAGFGLIIMLLAIISLMSFWSINHILTSQRELYHHELIDALDIKDIRSNQNKTRANLFNMLLQPDSNKREALKSAIVLRSSSNDRTLNQLLARNQNNPERLQKLQRFKLLREQFTNTRMNKIFPLIAAGNTEAARELIIGIQEQRSEEMQAIADALVATADKNVLLELEAAEQTGLFTMYLLGISSVLAFLLSIGLAAKIISNLSRISSKIREGVNVLTTSASEITASTSEVASGSVETATAVNETTSTIEQVKQTSEVSVNKAKHVAEIARNTENISESGKKSMNESIEAMTQIKKQMEFIGESIIRLSEQSQDIGEIITTVNDLAEQSNLLAVNASIEAAKAGEQGKGFAVVAQEVKNMAFQSKQATTQVRTILNDIQKAMNSAALTTEQGSKAVERGVKLSTETGESIRLLSESIAESSKAATQIMRSAEQQMIGMDQVAEAMGNINQASSQNVESTRQVEMAAQDLQALGQKLKVLINELCM